MTATSESPTQASVTRVTTLLMRASALIRDGNDPMSGDHRACEDLYVLKLTALLLEWGGPGTTAGWDHPSVQHLTTAADCVAAAGDETTTWDLGAIPDPVMATQFVIDLSDLRHR